MADLSSAFRGRFLLAAAAGVVTAILAGGGDASAEDLRGKVELLARGGKGAAKGSDVRQAVVFFEPKEPRPTRAPEAPFVISTEDKEFRPRVLAIPRGSKVRFPNSDPILHNVFSVSGANSFDFGLYRKGPGQTRRFDAPGLVRVFCNVHHSMVAYIWVLATPYSISPAADGSFTLSGVPKGPGKLTVWHEQAEPWTIELQVPTPGPVAARLEITRPRIPPHVDKSGRSYFRNSREKYGG